MPKQVKEYRCQNCGSEILYKGKGRPAVFCRDCKQSGEKPPESIAPLGVPVMPPDVPQPTILSGSAPKLIELTQGNKDPWGGLRAMADEADDEVTNIERRITLLARYIMEATLWDAVGMSKKERFDAAVNSIKTLEGSKSNVWVKDDKDKNLPKSQKKFFEEKQAVEKRLMRLMREKEKINDPEIRVAAEQLVAIDKGIVEEGEA